MIHTNDEMFEGIPYTRYYQKKKERSPLMFFFHGFTSNRHEGTMGRAKKLCSMGYEVIAVDAYGHGERYNKTIMALNPSDKYKFLVDIVLRTADDVRHLYEAKLRYDERLLPSSFSVYGVSMGAQVAFMVGKNMPECKVIVSIVGSPSIYKIYDYKRKVFEWKKDQTFIDKLIQYKHLDPLEHFNTFINKHIFMGCGEFDQTVPYQHAEKLYQLCNAPTHEFELYNVAHQSNDAMLNDAYEFLDTILKNNDKTFGGYQ